ncbi:hypothetical protein ACFE04_025353 [Oxalis oulophora]
MAKNAAKTVIKAAITEYPWQAKLAKHKDELSKGVWGFWDLGAWKNLGISVRHRARLRKEVLLAGQDWPYDAERKEMRVKMKGHKVDRIAAEKRAETGIIGLETEYGILNIKLLPDLTVPPHSIAYILELLPLHHCAGAGCQFYRAEGRGKSWDSDGNRINNAPFGPPFALLQGTLEAQGTTFKQIPKENCPLIQRGSVAWVGSGPEFFISLSKP